MSWIIYPLIALATFFIMEGITWLTHKYDAWVPVVFT